MMQKRRAARGFRIREHGEARAFFPEMNPETCGNRFFISNKKSKSNVKSILTLKQLQQIV